MLKIVVALLVISVVSGCTSPALGDGTLSFERVSWFTAEEGEASAEIAFRNLGDRPVMLKHAYTNQHLLTAKGAPVEPLNRRNGWPIDENGSRLPDLTSLVENGTTVRGGESFTVTARMQFREPQPSDFIDAYVVLRYSVEDVAYWIQVDLPCADWLGHELPRDYADFGWGHCEKVMQRRDY